MESSENLSGSNGDLVFAQLQPSLPLAAVLWSVGNCGARVDGRTPQSPWYSRLQRPRALGASAAWVSRRSQADCQPFAHSLVVFRALPPCVPLAECANKGSPWPNPGPSPHNCWLPVTMFLQGDGRPVVLPPLPSVLCPACHAVSAAPYFSPRGCLRAGGGDRKRWNHLHCDCTCPPTLKTQTPRKWGILHMPVSKVNPQRSRHFRWYPDIANDFECRFGCYLQNHGHCRTHPCPWASAAQL